MHLRIRVTGNVQGVGYRWNAAREARSLGITGFVKNMPDGSVLIGAEGSREHIAIFLEWCRTGPVHSYVTKVDTEVLPPENTEEFIILH